MLKAQRDLLRVRLEARQQIEQARAQAEAQFRAIDKWNGQMPTYVAGPVPILDVFKEGLR